ncbi:MAG: hypothetical protein HN348_21055 [Proteobacteria bacterium]|nr:hypothetical protein [Pseudomonadota bacterium]
MSLKAGLRYAFLASLVCAMGCDNETDDTDDTDDTDVTDETVTLAGTIVDAMLDTPIEGAEVCLEDPADFDCETTDAEGYASVSGLPTEHDVLVTVTATGYPDIIGAGRMEMDDITIPRFGIPSDGAIDLLETASGIDVEATKAQLMFTVTDASGTGIEGVAATLSTGGTAYYLDAGGLFAAAATETSTKGAGGFPNVATGDADLTLTHATLTCAAALAWEANNDGTFSVPLEADAVTMVSYVCE